MEENSTIMEKKINRFDKYMAYKGLNDNKVTVQLGLSIGVIGKARKGDRDLSSKVIEQILNFYTDLNRVWLLTGDGEMINPTPKTHLVYGGQTNKHGDNVNGDKITCDERLITLFEKHQQSLDRLISQQSRFLAIIENLTNNDTNTPNPDAQDR